MLSFEKIKPLGNGKITLLLTDRGKSCLSRGLMISKICLLILFTKIKFSQKFPNGWNLMCLYMATLSGPFYLDRLAHQHQCMMPYKCLVNRVSVL